MQSFKILLLTLTALYFAEARKLPSYLVPCSKSNRAKLNKCAIEHGISAIPNIIKGDKEFKLPPLSPFHLERIDINPGPQLKIKLTDITLKGIEKAVIEDIDADLANRHVQVKLYFDRIDIESQYDIDGKVSLLPIKGKGPAHLGFDGLYITYKADFDFETKKDGKKYINEKIRPSVHFKVKKAHFQFDNLFEGDKALGEHTNKFLNENDGEVVKDIGSSVSETISAVCTNILRRYISVIPYDDIFLP